MNPKIFVIDKSIINKCKVFSENVINTTDYSDSNQNDKQKEMMDHFIGKIGEFGAYLYLRSLGYKEVLEPDCKIYTNNKSWDEDLKCGDLTFGIKTQSYSMAKNLSKKFNTKLTDTISWTFQFGEQRKDKVFDNNDNNIIFTLYIKKFKTDVDRVLVFPIKKIGNIIFKESLMEHVRDSKKIAYGIDNYKDFEKWLVKFGI
jgi:hypothetical protein